MPASGVLRRLGWLALLAVMIAPLWYVHALNRYLPSTRSDLLPRWVGARAALHGEDPYSPEVLRLIQTTFYGHTLAPGDTANPEFFLYPAPVILFLAPLSHLSWPAARLTFLIVVIPLFAGSLWLCIRNLRIPLASRQTVVLWLLGFFSWPVIWGLRVQQLTLPVAALVFIAWYLLSREHRVLPGILLAIAAVKPQLVLPLILWLLLRAALRRHWSFHGSFAAAVAALFLGTEALVPGWFTRWRLSLHNYSGITHTSPPLEHLLGHWAGLLATALLAGWASLLLWRLRRCAGRSADFALAVSLALAVTICLIPTNPPLIYNYLLLFPACLLLLFAKPGSALASIVRLLALAQWGWDFLIVIVAALTDAAGHLSPLAGGLVFADILLPPLVTIALILSARERMAAAVAPISDVTSPRAVTVP